MKTKDVWKHGSNVLISIPVKQSEGRAALFYDMFNKKDMQLIRDNVKDVIGYRWGWNFDKYSTNGSWFIPELNIDEAREYVKKAKQELEETGNTRYADYEYVANQIERIDQTYPNDDFSREYTVVSDFSKYAGFKRIQEEEGNLQYLKPYSWNFKIQDVDMELVPYQMFEGYDFEMKYGKPMKDDKEVILSCTAAEELARQLSLSSIEELVGKEYMLQLENIKKTYETGYIDYAPVMTITVSGIFYEGNENEYQVYFKEGCFDKIFESWNEINPNYLQYQYLAFLVDEEADIKKVNEQINQLLEMKDSSFIQSSYLIEKEEDYQNSMNFYVFSFFTFIGLVALYCVMKMMYRKRNEKENEFFAVYNYHPFMILLLQLIMIFLLVGSILYLLLPSLCHYLNDFANSLQYMAIVKYDMSRYLISFTTALVILIMIEGVYYAIGIKKHK